MLVENNCAFCKIVRKEEPANIVYEDDDVIAFLDINPLQRGHTLVIPKEHFVNLLDVEPSSIARVAMVTRNVAYRLVNMLGADGVNTFSANGIPAGQQVFHFHVHVIPVGKGERTIFARSWEHLSETDRPDPSDLEDLALKLRM
jgi:diadenosine tetraphosphate (Ap4A) HIT family hydrolase